MARRRTSSKTPGPVSYRGYTITPRLSGDYFDIEKHDRRGQKHRIGGARNIEEAKRAIDALLTVQESPAGE